MDFPIHSQETEMEILKRLAPGITSRVMLDVGASTGVFASYFALLGWEVHAFEPCPEVFAKLSINLANMPNARCYPLALTESEGHKTLYIAEHADGTVMDILHSLAPYKPRPDFRWGGSTEVACTRLDSACATLGIAECPGILKIDTAGSELQVLKGLGEVRPEVIMAEFWEDTHPFGKCPSPPHLMLELLHEHGYRDYFFITRNRGEELVQINTCYLRPGDWGNIIAFHASTVKLLHAVTPEIVRRGQQALLSLVQMYRTAAIERLEALEAVTTDRDAWEARYRQLRMAYEAASQSSLMQSHIQRTIDLERALTEKEQVIQELHAEAERRREALEEIDQALRRERAERAKESEA